MGSTCGGHHTYPGLQFAAWNLTEDQLHDKYFPANFFN